MVFGLSVDQFVQFHRCVSKAFTAARGSVIFFGSIAENTNFFDMKREWLVQQKFKHLGITHRTTTIKPANRILRLEDGQLREVADAGN